MLPALPAPPPRDPAEEILESKFDMSYQTTLAIVEALGGPDPDHRAEVCSNILKGRFRGAATYAFPYPDWDSRLKGYQLAGVHWLLTLHSRGMNGILADEMGLGKTAQSCAFLGLLFAKGLVDAPAVVCCPATLSEAVAGKLHSR